MMIRAIKSAFPARAIKIAKPERSAIGLSVILTFLFILISMSLFWLGNSTKADIVYDQEIAKDAEPFEPFSPRETPLIIKAMTPFRVNAIPESSLLTVKLPSRTRI